MIKEDKANKMYYKERKEIKNNINVREYNEKCLFV